MKSTTTKEDKTIKVRSLLLKLSKEEKEALKELARKENRSMSGWVRNKIHLDMQKQGKPILLEN